MAETLEQKQVEIVLGDGSKITGKDLDDALKNAAKRIEDRTKDVKEAQEKATKLQAEVDGYKQSEEEKKAEADRLAALERQKNKDKGGFDKAEYYRLLNEDPLTAANYLDAARLGIDDPSQVPLRFNSMAAQISEINQERVASAFWRQHPEFPQEVTAARALDKRVAQFLSEGHPFSVRTFNMAYDELVGEETIKPMELEEKKDDKNKNRTEEERPNPQLSGGGRESQEDVEARKVENMDEKALEAYGREKGFIR